MDTWNLRLRGCGIFIFGFVVVDERQLGNTTSPKFY